MAWDNEGENRQAQEEEKRKKRRVYSTSLVNKLIEDRQAGYDIPYDAFFNRDLELRAPGVTFRMTDEEMLEYQKCYDDALYFIKNYCKFMTDQGRALVNLRDFQKKVIKAVTDEIWSDDVGDFIPKNRSLIWTAARQSGKCVVPYSNINVYNENTKEYGKTSFYKLYDNIKTHKGVLHKIKMYLYKIMYKL